MKLFYGADSLVAKPVFGAGNPTNDYGLGFYLTPNYDVAKLWASKNKNGGYLITYTVDLNKLRVLYLNNNTEEDVLKWITLLVNHRFSKDDVDVYRDTIVWLRNRFYPDLSDYDAIVGYRADDSYFAYSRSFLANEMSIELLSEAMKLGKLGLQYVLISERAFNKIKYENHVEVPYSKDYEIFREKTLYEYREYRRKDSINNTYIRDIMRKYSND